MSLVPRVEPEVLPDQLIRSWRSYGYWRKLSRGKIHLDSGGSRNEPQIFWRNSCKEGAREAENNEGNIIKNAVNIARK